MYGICYNENELKNKKRMEEVMVRIVLTDEESKLLKQFLLYFSMEEYNGFLGELNNKREEIDELLIDIYNQISEIIE